MGACRGCDAPSEMAVECGGAGYIAATMKKQHVAVAPGCGCRDEVARNAAGVDCPHLGPGRRTRNPPCGRADAPASSRDRRAAATFDEPAHADAHQLRAQAHPGLSVIGLPCSFVAPSSPAKRGRVNRYTHPRLP